MEEGNINREHMDRFFKEEYSDKRTQKNVNVIFDEKGRGIVIVNDIRFKGRRGINWTDVESYIRDYINTDYLVLDTADVIYIGTDLPSEIKGSDDTKKLKGAYAKAKANATTKIPLLLKYADNRRWQ